MKISLHKYRAPGITGANALVGLRRQTPLPSCAARPLVPRSPRLPAAASEDAPSTSAPTSAAASWQSADGLVSWIRSRGGHVHEGLTARYLGPQEGLALVLSETSPPLPAGTQLVRLPAACQLTYSDATVDPAVLSLIHAVPEELWGVKLALQLLHERVVSKGDSDFAAYIDLLPVGVQGLPMFFSQQAIKELQYPPVREQVRNMTSA
jgi:hypothetical protein